MYRSSRTLVSVTLPCLTNLSYFQGYIPHIAKGKRLFVRAQRNNTDEKNRYTVYYIYMTSTLSAGLSEIHKIPSDLKKALIADPTAVEKWEDITPLARNEWICWTLYPKTQATRDEHVKRVVSELKEGMRRPCCWIGCIHRKDKKISPSVKGILSKRSPS